jgi:hypothetical protein
MEHDRDGELPSREIEQAHRCLILSSVVVEQVANQSPARKHIQH